MSTLDEKLERPERSTGTRARATLAQIRKMNGFIEPGVEHGIIEVDRGGKTYVVRVMGDEMWSWRYVSGDGEKAIFERV